MTLEYSGLAFDQDIVATFASSRNTLLETVEATSNGSGVVEFELPERFSRYDGEYALVAYEGTEDNKGDVVLMDTVRVVRPYLDSAALAPTGREDEYVKFERTARIMIDNIVGGFYYTNAVYDLQGLGTDSLPIGNRVNKILQVIENNTLMYEQGGVDNVAEYTLNADKTAILLFNDGETSNLIDGRQVAPVLAGSDSYDYPQYRQAVFPNGYNYTVTVENGWPMVPQDIKEAAELIIEDMACGAPNYWAKYVRNYETNDYTVDFHRAMFAGTGNVIVDQILSRYLGDTLYNNIRVL